MSASDLLRAAAKNYESVIPVCPAADYESVLTELGRWRATSLGTRWRLLR